MGGNGGPSDAHLHEAQFTADEGMAAFDQLPMAVRRALSDSPIKWSACDILAAMKRGIMTQTVLAMLRQENEAHLARHCPTRKVI